MASNHTKFIRAVECAAEDSAFIHDNPRFRLMKRETLYARLEARGYMWSVEQQRWCPAQSVVARGTNVIQHIERSPIKLSGVFMIRILAPADEIEQVHGEFIEYAEALGWQVDSAPRQYPNIPDGAWVRRYYTVKRG